MLCNVRQSAGQPSIVRPVGSNSWAVSSVQYLNLIREYPVSALYWWVCVNIQCFIYVFLLVFLFKQLLGPRTGVVGGQSFHIT